jgi:hypothetical protein
VREEVERLEDHPNVAPQPRQIASGSVHALSIEPDRARVDFLEPVDAPQHRRLPRPRRASHDDRLTVLDPQVDIREDHVLTERLPHAGELYERAVFLHAHDP